MSRSKKKSVPASPGPSKTPTRPWIFNGINYGPAIGAVADIADWAFGLAAKDVEDWPEGRRRVRTARRYVLDRLRGKAVRSTPSEDVLFTAGLLARIFDAELSLGMTEMVSIFDELGLPTEVVPLAARERIVRPNVGGVLPFARTLHAQRAEPEPTECPVCLLPRLRNAA